MANTTSVNLRIDKELKTQAEALFLNLGMNMTTAINIFLRQAVRDQGIPFRVSAAGDYNTVSAYKGTAGQAGSYERYVEDSLRAADSRIAEGKMRYYTAEEIKAGLEEILNGKV